MGLAVKRKNHRSNIVLWGILIILIGLLVTTSVYMYRWYTKGEALPISIPVFATADPTVDETVVTETEVDEYRVAPERPRFLSIPTIGLEPRRVYPVGVEPDGALGAPANIDDVGWYDKSALPGSGGVVLMDGHNAGITRSGAFARLGELKYGDVIEVEMGDGSRYRYAVRENQSMSVEDVNSYGMKMMAESAEPGVEALNLITCDGRWIPQIQQFDRRIMLRAVLVGQTPAPQAETGR